MAGVTRKLKLQIGLVTFDIGKVKATEDERKPFETKQLHVGCGGETGNIVYCKQCSKQNLTTTDKETGIRVGKGQYITVPQQELDNVKIPSDGVVEVLDVVDQDQILTKPWLFNGKVNYLTPLTLSRGGIPQAFSLLHEGLQGQVIIGRNCDTGKEHLMAILPGKNGSLIACNLRYQHEVRDEPHVTLLPNDPNQLSMMQQIIGLYRKPSPDLDRVDRYYEAMVKLYEDKVAGVVTLPATAPVEAPPDTSSINDQMLKTLEALKAQRAAQAKPAPEPPKAEEPVAKKKAGKKGKAA